MNNNIYIFLGFLDILIGVWVGWWVVVIEYFGLCPRWFLCGPYSPFTGLLIVLLLPRISESKTCGPDKGYNAKELQYPECTLELNPKAFGAPDSCYMDMSYQGTRDMR